MATCEWCNQDMMAVDSCSGNKTVDFADGSSFWSIPYDPEYGGENQRCHDCNVKRGGYHHMGCDMEECPSDETIFEFKPIYPASDWQADQVTARDSMPSSRGMFVGYSNYRTCETDYFTDEQFEKLTDLSMYIRQDADTQSTYSVLVNEAGISPHAAVAAIMLSMK